MNDLDLIQDFRNGVSAPDDERSAAARARLMAEVRITTEAEIAPATRRRRGRGDRALHGPRRVALRLGLPVVAVVAGAAAIVLFSDGGGATSAADAAIIRHAAAALAAPPNEIFHYELQGDGFNAESWQLTSAPYSVLAGKGPLGSMSYASNDGTTVAHYDPASNTIDQSPSIKPPSPDDPLTEIKQELQDGKARVLGTATVDGTATYEVQLADNNGFDAQSMIAYVDQSSYRPIEIADPQRNGTIVQLRVATFEYLAVTPANQSLLSLTTRYPDARVVNNLPPSETTGSK